MQIRYENNEGESIILNKWPLMIQTPEDLYINKWSSTQASRNKMTFKKEKQEQTVTLQVFANSKEEFTKTLNSLMEITEKDVELNECGRLWIEKDEEKWYVECNISGVDYSDYEEDYYTVDKKITIIAASWKWNKEITKKFEFENEEYDQSGHSYPYDYPYDYNAGSGYSKTIENEGFSASNMIITIYGYAYHPEIMIGGHQYKLNCIVNNNQKAVIDTRERTIRLINLTSGEVRNAFMYREQDSNIFEKLPPGEQKVYWNTDFNFDITILIERSEPEWL